MKINDEKEVVVEKLSNLGYGIAKDEGLVIFVENACPNDKLKVKITKVTKNYANASVIEILEPSEYRVEPFCKMSKVCGGCQLQHIDYDYQLKLKKQIVEDAMRNIGNIDTPVNDTIASPQVKEYRHKVQYPTSQTKVSKRILAGYFKPQTHEIVNIKHCPIQPEICDKIIDYIRQNASKYEIKGYNEKKHSGDLRHIQLRVSAATGKVLVTLVINATKSFERLNSFANAIYSDIKEVSGVCVNFNSKKTNVILGEKIELIAGKDFIKERILDKTFRIGSKTFFQINPKSAENIFKFVRDYLASHYENPLVLDAYSGVSSFGITISDVCKKVVCVEEVKESVDLAQEILAKNEIHNVELHNMDASKFFEKELKTKKRKFDSVLLDPPRKGCSKESLDFAFELSNDSIIYISCNPATLARDLKILKEKGCSIELLQPVDMFCHTYHIETVAVVKVNK